MKGEGSEDTSMTDDWAEFHEKELEKVKRKKLTFPVRKNLEKGDGKGIINNFYCDLE